MRVTTVAVLFFGVVVCCNAQTSVATSSMKVVTRIHNGVGTAKYLTTDSAHVMVKPGIGRSLNDLVQNGFLVVRSFDKDYVIVKASLSNRSRLKEFAATILPVNHLWKLSENLLTLDFKKDLEYIVITNAPDDLRDALKKFDVRVATQRGVVLLRGNISAAFDLIVSNEHVTYVGLESLTPKEEGRVLDLYHGPNKINRIHHEFPALNGAGISVSIKERQFDPSDIDLIGRTIPSSIAHVDTSNHATEMATIIAGAGNSFITGKGVTTNSKITSSSFLNLFPDSESHFTGSNSFLQNHAYGTVVENFYGALANAYDVAANQNLKVLHVFSSGNSGTSVASSGGYVNAPGYSNLTGNSKMAKNVLVVGSVDTTGNAIVFSSRGPANDGRVKPEMVAYSTAGTSNSAALVTGAAAILQQAYKQSKGTYPDAALLKAILINGAEDVGPPGPDFATGYGNLNAYRSLKNLLDGKYFEGTITQGQVISFDIEIPEQTKNLKATLVWSDPAAPVNSSNVLVNNLDLEIMSSGEIMQPWILDASPNAPSLSSPATRGIDTRNNVEQVTVELPSFQTYHIRVRGISLASPQKFFIAYQLDEDNTFTWNYPTASDNFPYNGETGTYFYWNSTLTDASGTLEVTTDNGQTWNSIAADLDLKKGFYRWNNPFHLNTSAKARMVVGSVNYETEEFTISRALLPSVGFNCADSVLLQWHAMDDVSAYEIQALQGNYLLPVTKVSDTLVVMHGNESSDYYSVQPVLESGKNLLRSPAVNIQTFGAGCFVSTFVDESISEEGILLRLELGTTYGIQSISFEQQTAQGFISIHTVEQPADRVIRFLHTEPFQGLNRYRARIHLVNNQEVLSDTVQNYFLTKTPFIVFPNPVWVGEQVSVFSGKSDTAGSEFKLYKSDGTWVRSWSLVSDREFLSMAGLSPGLYLYRIESSAGRVSGKIVVEGR